MLIYNDLPPGPWGLELAKFPSLQLLEFEITYISLRDDLQRLLDVLHSSPHAGLLKSLHIHGNVLRYPRQQARFLKDDVAVRCLDLEHMLLSPLYVDTVTTVFLLGDLKSSYIPGAVRTLQTAFPNLHQRGLLNIEYNTGKVLFQTVGTDIH